jgi:hypothetical protein
MPEQGWASARREQAEHNARAGTILARAGICSPGEFVESWLSGRLGRAMHPGRRRERSTNATTIISTMTMQLAVDEEALWTTM